MSKVTMSGKRTDVAAEQELRVSWTRHGDGPTATESLTVTMIVDSTAGGKDRYLRVVFTPADAAKFAAYTAQRLTRELDDYVPGFYKKISDAQALRRLADVIEGHDTKSLGPTKEQLGY